MRHPLDPTTHTIEMEQIEQVNAQLKQPGATGITAADLGLEGSHLVGHPAADSLSPRDVVRYLSWTGAPDFPDIFAHFGAPGGDTATTRVQLHTAHLRELSGRIHLTQHWGL
jgi:hypothetical protein